MREVVFRVVSEQPGLLQAQADTLPLRSVLPPWRSYSTRPVKP